ncbi:kinase-like domain-containing protein [Cladochytrium replicatum]|nr:kinase-like domain-containing protein [Cladochytrium replicatum]
MDKKRQEEVGEKLAECNAKVALLTKAFQRYKSIWVADDEEENDDAGDGPSTANPLPSPVLSTKFSANSKRLYSGKLKIRLVTATNLPNRKSTSGQLYGVIRVDGVQKAKTRPTTRKWNEEFDISVDKAQEVEISVYEKGGNNVLALMWFKLWELEEELQLRTRGQMSIGGGEEAYVQNLSSAANGFVDGVEAKLELEPSGQLLLRANFGEFRTVDEYSAKQGVFRRPPVQKALPKRGHKFVPQQFYQVMKCAVCQEFLLSGAGYQCQLCKYTCHKRCMPRVINKCISKTEQEQPTTPAYAQILNHRIPHRFEPTSNIGAAWCCHCGYMLPVGKKQSLKCGECGLSSHKECMPLVPTLCGMSAEMMDQMKLALEDAERAKRDKESGASPAAKRQQQGNQRRQTQSARPMSLATSDTSLASAGGSSPLLPPQAVPSTPQQQIQVPQKQVGAPVSPQPVVSSVQLPPQVPPQQQQQQVVPHPRPQKGIGLDDFNFLAVLGKGNFGKVMLAEEKYSKHLYAIKVLKKEFIIENDEVESTRSEKRVFLTANRERHPFLVNLHSCFQTESRIYFVMEYVSGGDLMWHIQHQQFSEKRAKFYACEVLLALEYFHKNNVVYRDLKLDNILLSLEGHIKIADYGLCKEGMTYGATTNTFCGTPEFMAPEILLEKPYTRAVDWWALGVLIYEMLLGQSPFRGDDEDEIFEAILKDEILYPVNMAKDAVTLLQKLLTKDPAKRLGSGRGDAEDIKRHPFFKGVDWDAMLKLQIAPPYKPKISSPTDVSCFDEEFTREMPVLTPCHSVLSAADQEEFRGFTYISEWAQQKRQEALAGGSSSRVPGS